MSFFLRAIARAPDPATMQNRENSRNLESIAMCEKYTVVGVRKTKTIAASSTTAWMISHCLPAVTATRMLTSRSDSNTVEVTILSCLSPLRRTPLRVFLCVRTVPQAGAGPLVPAAFAPKGRRMVAGGERSEPPEPKLPSNQPRRGGGSQSRYRSSNSIPWFFRSQISSSRKDTFLWCSCCART